MPRIRFNQLLDLARALRAFENERAVLFCEVAKDCKDFVEQLINRLAAGLRVGSHFAKNDHRAIAVLVANEISAAVTITFFDAKYVKRTLIETNEPCVLYA